MVTNVQDAERADARGRRIAGFVGIAALNASAVAVAIAQFRMHDAAATYALAAALGIPVASYGIAASMARLPAPHAGDVSALRRNLRAYAVACGADAIVVGASILAAVVDLRPPGDLMLTFDAWTLMYGFSFPVVLFGTWRRLREAEHEFVLENR